jgi:hypothetical protein
MATSRRLSILPESAGRPPSGFASRPAQLVADVVGSDPGRDWRVKEVQIRLQVVAPSWVKDPRKWAENHASRGLADLERHGAVLRLSRGKYRVLNLANAVFPFLQVLFNHYARTIGDKSSGRSGDGSGRRLVSIATRRRYDVEALTARRVARRLISPMQTAVLRETPSEFRPDPMRVRQALEAQVSQLELVVRQVLSSSWPNPPRRRS